MTDAQQQQVNGEATERPHTDLQKRLGTTLSRDDTVGSDELRGLIKECDDSMVEIEIAIHAYETAALRIECQDPLASKQAAEALGLEQRRFELVKLRLCERLAHAIRRERREAWEADFLRVEEKVEAAAQRFSKYPALVAELISIFQEAKAVDAEVDRINGSAMGSERLLYVELAARGGLDRHDRENPSLAETVTLFDWKNSSKQIWPPPRQSMGVLMAQSMVPAYHPGDRWYKAQADRRAEQESENGADGGIPRRATTAEGRTGSTRRRARRR